MKPGKAAAITPKAAEPSFASSKGVSLELDVTHTAVGNWLERGVLPAHLLPFDWIWHGPDNVAPLWTMRQVALFKAWHKERQAASAGAGDETGTEITQ